MNQAVVLIATRPDSTRLPRKAFKKVAGYPAIEHILKRLQGCFYPIYLCIPYHCDDYNYLIDLYKNQLDLHIYRGDIKSPLHRMASCLKDEHLVDARWVIRITHDDILVDLKTIFSLLRQCDSTDDAGYGITPTIVEGAGVEIIHADNLKLAADKHREPIEFVSYFVKNHPHPKEVRMRPRPSIERKYRLTMDYEEDFIVLDSILKATGPFASLDDIVAFIDQNPTILNINQTPRVSVYTCAYNAEKFIGQCVSSVLWSNRYLPEPFEYVFVDDGSSDRTIMELSKYVTDDRRIKILMNEQNEGLAFSSNKALNHCRGNYVMRVDADDWLIPGSIHRMIQEMDKTGAGIIYSGYHETDENGVRTKEVLPDINHHAGCALMEKRMINEIRFTDGLRHWDSLDLYNRIKAKNFRVGYINDPLWYYRRSLKSLSSKNTKDRLKAYDEVMGYAKN